LSLKIRQLDRLLLLLNDSDTLDNRRGRPGEILYDWTNNTLRIYSARPGDPDGGMALVKSDLSNVDPSTTITIAEASVGSLKIVGSTITSTDSSAINLEQTLDIGGSLSAQGSLSLGGSAQIGGSVSAQSAQFSGAVAMGTVTAAGVGTNTLGALQFVGSSISSTDSTQINLQDNVDVLGNLTISGNLVVGGGLVTAFTADAVSTSTLILSDHTVTAVSTDTALAAERDTALPTERAVKLYVDTTLQTEYFQQSATPPSTPLLGSFWLDTSDSRLYHRQNSGFWVEIGGTSQITVQTEVMAVPTTIVERDSSGDIFAAAFNATDAVFTPRLAAGATTAASGEIEGQWTLVGASTLQATYADLAEYHSSDQAWPPGTVIMINDQGLMTQAHTQGTARVMGVVTTDPAYVMNSDCPEPRVCLALAGCVPVWAWGPVRPGDLLVQGTEPGSAQTAAEPQMGTVIGKSLEQLAAGQRALIKMLVMNR